MCMYVILVYVLAAEAGPKKILDLMGEPSLTRENVASHLQVPTLYYQLLLSLD